MGVCSDKVELKVSGKRIWKGVFEEPHSFLPKASGHAIERVDYEGPGFVAGSVRTIHFHKGHAEKMSVEKHPGHLVLWLKEKVEHVDHAAMKLKMSVTEGGFVGVLVKHYTVSFHVEETGPSSSCVHWSVEYEPLSEDLSHVVPEVLKEAIPNGFVEAEAYLLAHPNECV